MFCYTSVAKLLQQTYGVIWVKNDRVIEHDAINRRFRGVHRRKPFTRANQVIPNTGFESPCSTKEESCRFSPLWSEAPRTPARGFLTQMAKLSVAFSPPSLRLRRALLVIHTRPSGRSILAKESNGLRLHGGNPIGPSTLLRMVSLSNHFVPDSRGGVYIESIKSSLGIELG